MAFHNTNLKRYQSSSKDGFKHCLPDWNFSRFCEYQHDQDIGYQKSATHPWNPWRFENKLISRHTETLWANFKQILNLLQINPIISRYENLKRLFKKIISRFIAIIHNKLVHFFRRTAKKDKSRLIKSTIGVEF